VGVGACPGMSDDPGFFEAILDIIRLVITEAGMTWLLVLVLLGALLAIVRYLLTTHEVLLRESIIVRQKMAGAFKAMHEAFKELQEEIRRR